MFSNLSLQKKSQSPISEVTCCHCSVKLHLTFWDPMYCSTPASLSFTTSQSLLRFMSPVLMMISNHLILCCSPLFLTSICPSIRVFSNELALHTRWQSIGASASILPMNIQGWYLLELTALISLRLRVLRSLLQHHNQKALAFSLLYGPALTSIHDYWKYHNFD